MMLGQIEFPVIVAMKGRQCTGKSTIAKRLGYDLTWLIVDVDHIRSSMADLQQHAPPPSPLTALEHLDLVSLEAACQVALTQIRLGFNIIIDSSLSHRSHLDRLLQLSGSTGAVLVIIECEPDPNYVRRQWLQQQIDDCCTSRCWYKASSWDDLEDLDNVWVDYDHGDIRKLTVDTAADTVGWQISFPVLELAKREHVYCIHAKEWTDQMFLNKSRETERTADRRHSPRNHVIRFSGDRRTDLDEVLIRCNKCLEPISSSVYNCSHCNLYLHKTCAESPSDLELLPQDCPPLVHQNRLEFSFPELCRCDACVEDDIEFSNSCEGCIFQSHLECNLLPTVVRHRGHGHGHPLALAIHPEPFQGDPSTCDACGNHVAKPLTYICQQCAFACHVNCAFLPSTFKHKNHLHPLSLAFSTTPPKDDLDVIYCDECELERNPKHWFYKCSDCLYTCHSTCIVPSS